MSNDGSNAQSANARELIERLHDLGKLLVNRRTAGMSNQAVPAPEDSRGEHKAAQRRLVNICTMVRPAARDVEGWKEPIAQVEIPTQENETAQTALASVQMADGGAAGITPSHQKLVAEMLGGPVDRSPQEISTRTAAVSLAHLASWTTLTVPYERDRAGRASGTETIQVEAYLPMSFTQAAVTQLWGLLDEIDLGVPHDSRPFRDYS